MATSKFALIIPALITAGLATVATMQHQSNARLRAELAARDNGIVRLQAGTKQAVSEAVDPDELATLRNEHTELLRLRGEIGLMRQQDRERRALQAENQPKHTPAAPKGSGEFVAADSWANVGAETPQNAFQSFMAVLKAGDPTRIESAIHWDLKWKEDINDEDRQLMEKSKQDYLKMLERAPSKVAAFSLAPTAQGESDRTRVFFHLLTTEGTEITSNFEMVQLEGQWKPVLAMGWRYPKDPSSFFTSAMFGPAIDLEQ